MELKHLSPKGIRRMIPAHLRVFLERRLCTSCNAFFPDDTHDRLVQVRAMLRKSGLTDSCSYGSVECHVRRGIDVDKVASKSGRALIHKVSDSMPAYSSLSNEDIQRLCAFFETLGWPEAKVMLLQRWSGLFGELEILTRPSRGICGL